MGDKHRPQLHVCYAPEDRGWVYGRMVCELGLHASQYLTREDDDLGEMQLQAVADAVERCSFTVLIASSAARWDKLAQFAAGLAQHAGLEDQTRRLIILARDFAPSSDVERARLSLPQRALVGLDCSNEASTTAALARLRDILALEKPTDERAECPYPGLARFTAANRDLLFGRDQDKAKLVQRIRAGHSRLLIVGPSGSGKSSLIHAAVLPELTPRCHLLHIVPRGDCLAAALRDVIDELEIPRLGVAIDAYVATARGASDAQIDEARTLLRTVPIPDGRRRVVVVDPLEEVFAEEDAASRETLFALLGGLWSMPWCTVILCMRADFYGDLMVERCWRELESCQYPIAPLDEAGLRAAIVQPAIRAGVHVDAVLVERLIREIDRDRSSVQLPLLQVALKELWSHLRWRYLTLADYERIVDRDQRGLAAVLAVHADGVMQQLTAPRDRAVAQRILLDLVHLGEGRPHTRRRRDLDELRRSGDVPGQLERVLDQLIEDRLVTTGDDAEGRSRDHQDAASFLGMSRFGRHIDLAHDTLITGWPELAGWIAARRDDLRTQRRLETRAATRVLLTSSELPEFLRWVDSTASPASQPLGVSDGLLVLVRRSVVARRLRRSALGVGLMAVTAIAVVFGLQAQRLRTEKTKTQQSISQAMETADTIVNELDRPLQWVAGTSLLRERLLKQSHELIKRLRMLGELKADDQQTEMMAKVADAELAFERGNIEQASALYSEALADAQRRAATDPSTLRWQYDLGFIYDRLGEAVLSAGRFEEARGWFGKALAMARKFVALDSSNTAYLRPLGLSYERLGRIALRTGQLDDAQSYFEKALSTLQKLTAIAPSNNRWQHDVGTLYSRLGEVALSAGKLDDARSYLDKALSVGQKPAAADPSRVDWQRDLSVTYNLLGQLAMRGGRLEDANSWFDKALVVVQRLATTDPSNIERQRDLSASYNNLGEVAVRAGNLDDARGWFSKELAVTQELAAADPSNTQLQHNLSVSYGKLGDIAVSSGQLEDARGRFNKALTVAQKLTAADPSNVEWQRNLSVSYGRLGDVAMRAGQLDDARGWFNKALAEAPKLVATDPDNANSQSAHCITLATRDRAPSFTEATRSLSETRAIYDCLIRSGATRGDKQLTPIGQGPAELAGVRTAPRR